MHCIIYIKIYFAYQTNLISRTKQGNKVLQIWHSIISNYLQYSVIKWFGQISCHISMIFCILNMTGYISQTKQGIQSLTNLILQIIFNIKSYDSCHILFKLDTCHLSDLPQCMIQLIKNEIKLNDIYCSVVYMKPCFLANMHWDQYVEAISVRRWTVSRIIE